jgi:hypothetical protein
VKLFRRVSVVLGAVALAGSLSMSAGAAGTSTSVYHVSVNIFPAHSCTGSCVPIGSTKKIKFNAKRTPKTTEILYRDLATKGTTWVGGRVVDKLTDKKTDMWTATATLKGACLTKYGAIDSTLVEVIFNNGSGEYFPINVPGEPHCPGM